MTYFAGKGHEVVFTKREYVNVPNNDHLIVVLREDSIINHICLEYWFGYVSFCTPKLAAHLQVALRTRVSST